MALPKIKHTIFTTEIPSLKKKVNFRQFTTKEEKIMLMARTGDESDMLAAIKQVTNNCLIQDDIDIDTLTIFDLEWLFIKARAVSVSNIVNPAYRDNEDDKVYKFEINLDDLKVEWPIEKPPTIKLSDEITITMKWPTADLYSDSQLLKADGVESLFRLIVNCIDTIFTADQVYDPKDYSTEDLLAFIEDVEVKPFEQIQEFFNQMPGIRYTIEYTNSMGTERKIVLSSLSDFFQF